MEVKDDEGNDTKVAANNLNDGFGDGTNNNKKAAILRRTTGNRLPAVVVVGV